MDGGLDRDPEARRARHAGQRPGRLVTQVGDQFDGDARLMQVERGAIGLVMGGGDDDALADLDAKKVEIAPRRARQHDPRPVVVGEDERPLDGAGREHDLAARIRHSRSRGRPGSARRSGSASRSLSAMRFCA